jgi:hypothetical protein
MSFALRLRCLFLTISIGFAVSVSAETTDKTIVMGDGSGSMQGFAKAGSARMSALFQLLVRNTDLGQLSVLTTNSKTGTASINPVSQSNYFGSAASYRGGTDLVYALQHIRKNTSQAVFVTDGMQSEGLYLRVKDEIKQIAGEGWGIWLFAIKMPFDGLYDPEQQLNVEEAKPLIEQCITKDDPNAHITFRTQKSNRYFNYTGLRPILIFVFAKHADAGRQLTRRIEDNLKADPQFPTHVVELTPLFYRGVGFGDPKAVSDYVRLDNAADKSVVRSDTVDGQRTKELQVPIVWLDEAPTLSQAYDEVPRWDANKPTWIEEEIQTVDRTGTDPKAIGDMQIRFVSELSWFRNNFCFLPFISCVSEKTDLLNLTIWTEFAPSDSAWWQEMNTDTSWQCPSRVYKLSELTTQLGQMAVDNQTAAHKPKTRAIQLIVGPL